MRAHTPTTTPSVLAAPAYLSRAVGPHSARLHCPSCLALIALGWTATDAEQALGSHVFCEVCCHVTETRHLHVEAIAPPLPYYAAKRT